MSCRELWWACHNPPQNEGQLWQRVVATTSCHSLPITSTTTCDNLPQHTTIQPHLTTVLPQFCHILPQFIRNFNAIHKILFAISMRFIKSQPGSTGNNSQPTSGSVGATPSALRFRLSPGNSCTARDAPSALRFPLHLPAPAPHVTPLR